MSIKNIFAIGNCTLLVQFNIEKDLYFKTFEVQEGVDLCFHIERLLFKYYFRRKAQNQTFFLYAIDDYRPTIDRPVAIV